MILLLGIKRGVEMEKSRRAALNLSVNAIVIFVLAFAMLGVGVAFINQIREQIGDVTIDPGKLKNPPSRDDPFTHPSDLIVSVTDTEDFEVGVFNNEAFDLEDVTIMLYDDQGVGNEAECLDTAGEDSGNFGIVAPSRDILVGDGIGYRVSLYPSGAEANSKYICTIVAYADGNDEIVYQGDIIVQTTA